MLSSSAEPLDLDILVLPQSTLMLVAAVVEPLRAANRVLGQRLYRWRLVGREASPVATTSGIPIPVAGAFGASRRAAPLFVVASYDWQGSATPALIRVLRQAAGTRPAIVGIESGSWLLATAGLLDGHRATTHWEDFDDFESRFPDVELVRRRYVIDGTRATTGGSLPTLDLMLEILRRRQGYSLAMEVSKLFIYDPAGGRETDYRAPSVGNLRALDARVANAVEFMEATIDDPLSIDDIAAQVGVTARYLQTLFKASLGATPHAHYLALRLNRARRLVIETRQPMIDIATQAGFASAAAFSRCYRAHYRESPTETRRLEA
jgi:transcriptional regulator GlxA family with amidase domain